ncbi:MaoC family dehydratase [Hymenobacter busanensis]|uniref:MaoC family dehydratase n=1 Tax=Hymenobacter busanensis TaxID=2607656 RepID=A0A7L4ZWK6_9BACT|nr:MaoC family dehydratase [Hymenobacter busanensis]KAA9332280.1 MaoC family dehydratase [Hymenobacter busanensis]QHJ07383.1 enoyl-CoA hydratase [Hymenobacter busanensis]
MPEIGQKAQLSKTITDADVRTFAELSLDTNPVHLDDEYAKNSLFGQRISHGMLYAGLVSAVLGTKLPGPGSIYMGQTMKFLKPVFIGDTITAEAEVTAVNEEKQIVTLNTTCTNQHGKVVLAGEATLKYA